MRRVKFSALLNAIAEQHGTEAKTLVQAGRQRQWVKTRSMLVYMAREYGGMTVKELGKRLNRDPSIISRLYSAYTESRDRSQRAAYYARLDNKSIRMPGTKSIGLTARESFPRSVITANATLNRCARFTGG